MKKVKSRKGKVRMTERLRRVCYKNNRGGRLVEMDDNRIWWSNRGGRIVEVDE